MSPVAWSVLKLQLLVSWTCIWVQYPFVLPLSHSWQYASDAQTGWARMVQAFISSGGFISLKLIILLLGKAFWVYIFPPQNFEEFHMERKRNVDNIDCHQISAEIFYRRIIKCSMSPCSLELGLLYICYRKRLWFTQGRIFWHSGLPQMVWTLSRGSKIPTLGEVFVFKEGGYSRQTCGRGVVDGLQASSHR